MPVVRSAQHLVALLLPALLDVRHRAHHVRDLVPLQPELGADRDHVRGVVLQVGFGRIVVSEIEAPNLFANQA